MPNIDAFLAWAKLWQASVRKKWMTEIMSMLTFDEWEDTGKAGEELKNEPSTSAGEAISKTRSLHILSKLNTWAPEGAAARLAIVKASAQTLVPLVQGAVVMCFIRSRHYLFNEEACVRGRQAFWQSWQVPELDTNPGHFADDNTLTQMKENIISC